MAKRKKNPKWPTNKRTKRVRQIGSTKKRKSIKKLKDKADDLVKQVVRLRDLHTCQKSGKYVEGSNAHTAHVIAKSQSTNLRWNLVNIVLLSFHEHQAFHIRGGMGQWFKKKWPHRWRYLNEPISQSGVAMPRCNHKWVMTGKSLREKEEWMEKIIAGLEAKLKELKNG